MKRLIRLLVAVTVLSVLPLLPSQASAQAAQCDGRQVTIDLSRNGGNGNGTAGPDVILGTSGADTIRGFGGDDTICAGGGDDVVYGGQGNDIIFGGTGSDTIRGGHNADEIEGGAGNDFLYGQNGWDRISASSGNDTIEGGLGNDWIWAGTGADSLDGGPGNDLLLGFDGNDTITAGGGNDKMNGMNGDDTINAGDGADQIWGGRGNDTIDAGTGFDWVWGSWGSDTINGGHGNDSLFGEGHSDTINGGPGNDTLDGGFDFDVCAGNNGNDTATQCESSTGVGSTPPPAELRCLVRLHGKGGEGGDSRMLEDDILLLRPNGNGTGWGKLQWEYDTDAALQEATSSIVASVDSANCTRVVIHGFSNGASMAAALHCSGNNLGGRLVGVVVDDPVTDAAVVDCSPATNNVVLYWTGALNRPIGTDCARIDWTCAGGFIRGVDAYAADLGIAATQSPPHPAPLELRHAVSGHLAWVRLMLPCASAETKNASKTGSTRPPTDHEIDVGAPRP